MKKKMQRRERGGRRGGAQGETQRGRERKGGGDEHTSFEDDTREEIATKKVR